MVKSRGKNLDEGKIFLFQVKGLKDTSKAMIKAIGYADETSEHVDERMDVVKDIMNGDEKSVEIIDNVTIKFNKPNITQTFILANKKLPVMYASVVYNKPLVTGVLFNITMFFEITSDTQKIKSFDQLLQTELEGKFTTNILMDDKAEVIEMDKFSGYPKTVKNIINILKSESMVEIVKAQLKKRDEERIARLGSLADFKPSIPKYNISELANKEDIDDTDF